MSNRVNFVLFGLGRAGSIHVDNILQNTRADLKYIVEEDTAKAQNYLDENNSSAQVLPVAKASVALSDPAVKAVVVCIPTPYHEKYVLMSLKAGKAVFCEKPIAHSAEATAACFDEAESLGLPLFCAFNRRFDPGLRRIIQAAKQGKLGQIHMTKQTSRDFPLPQMEYLKVSNGIFHDCGVHDIDVALMIAGEAPCTVYAQAHSFVPSIKAMGDVDCVAITLKFPSGIIAQIDLDRFAAYGCDQRFEVFGDKGMLRTENMTPTSVQFASGEGVLHDPNLYSFPQRYAESYVNELNHFIDVVLGKSEMEVTRDEALLACKVAFACEESYQTGQAVHFEN